MTKITKILLALAVACLVLGGAFNTGLLNAQGMDALYAVLPLGAVFAGLFLIARVLEKESTRYDEEQLALRAGAAPSIPAQRGGAAPAVEQQARGTKAVGR